MKTVKKKPPFMRPEEVTERTKQLRNNKLFILIKVCITNTAKIDIIP